MGIKGQYLIFDSGVINIRKYTGYEVEVRAHSIEGVCGTIGADIRKLGLP